MTVSEKDKIKNALQISRRSFMKWSAMLGAAASVGCGAFGSDDDDDGGSTGGGVAPQETFEYDKAVWNGCNVNCGSNCPLKLYVKDGVVVRVETDSDSPDEYGEYGTNYQFRSCVRGRSVRQRIYHPDRLKYPMKRVAGSIRGEGKYERISWEQAINEISAKMQEVKSNYGPDAFYIQYATGTIDAKFSDSWPPAASPIARLHNLWGGWLQHYSDYSTSQITAALCLIEGSSWSNNTITDAVNSNLVVLWGNNPANTRMGAGRHFTYHLQKAKEQNPNLKVVVVDPHYTDTAVALDADWVPVRPGTDSALVAGMAYYLYQEGLVDEAWLAERAVGWDEASMSGIKEVGEGYFPPAYDPNWGDSDGTEPAVPVNSSYKAYILGDGPDGTAKTPEWAAAVTGVSVSLIKSFAKRLMEESPAMVIQGWGPQRHSLGGNNTRAIGLMTILTKNIGITGGGSSAREGAASVGLSFPGWSSTFPGNDVKQQISNYTWYQAIVDHTVMTGRTWGVRGFDSPDEALKNPIKFIWNYAGNCMLNQHGDINKMLEIYKDDTKCECIVNIDNYFTPSAMVADYLLPDCTNWEQNDVSGNSGGNTASLVFQNKAVEPPFECITIYEMMSKIAAKLGIEQEYTEGKTQDEWLEYLFNKGLESYGDQGVFTAANGLDTYEKAHAQGLVKKYDASATPSVAYKSFVEDPQNNSVSTPSGKFEIFSKRLYNLSHQWQFPAEYDDGLDQITPLPQYYDAYRGYGDPARSTYPFQIIGHHFKQRTHSTYQNCSWNREASPQTAWVNTKDAADLGIKHGDLIEVYNELGRVRIPAKVTSRIMPGVISIPQGAWYNPEGKWFNNNLEHSEGYDSSKIGSKDVLDYGGCVNALTSLRPGPVSKGNCQHSILANVKKIG
ncbi:DMSO/selenate family reductase complex A subunit [Limisalsivibrio acetivorans]|uniref:DMSO/selenate family reductase complex A subunit n=1 Tax=Limisalsivibrio acetivorans TaxID=1304888 RepID=UPI0003B6EEF3|nr:DMSO/selenate family reductase complex A subunit [Limisalsivibrio acetivorans]